MNLLEMQLRSWEPRTPSADLKQRLFPSRANHPPVTAALRWLAPALTCAILAVVLVNQEAGVSTGLSRYEPAVIVASSNHSSSASFSNATKRTGSLIPSGTFESTNRGDLSSNLTSLLPVKLN